MWNQSSACVSSQTQSDGPTCQFTNSQAANYYILDRVVVRTLLCNTFTFL